MQTLSPERTNGPLPGYYETRRLDFEVPKTERVFANLNEIINYAAIEQRARELVGAHVSPEKNITVQEYEDNARTALFEGLTRSGHLTHIEFDDDIETVHNQVMTRLLNGYDRSLPQHELDRRFREICEELAIQEIFRKIVSGEVPPDMEITTFSDFPEPLATRADSLGYRQENRKGMIRSTWLTHHNGQYRRVLEQLSRSNSNAYETTMMLHEQGVSVSRRGELDVDLLGTQVGSLRRAASEGVVGIMRRLDAYSGPNIMYGEEQTVATPPYESLRRISAHREELMQGAVQKLAQYEAELDARVRRGEITYRQWQTEYMREVQAAIRIICVIDPSYTRGALGAQVEAAYNKAHGQYMVGDLGGAQATIAGVASIENRIVICGGMTEEKGATRPDAQKQSGARERQWLESSKKWEFIDGRCRISNCPTSGIRTKVGPCEVCMMCQSHFDANRNPVQVYSRQQQYRALTQALAQSKPAAHYDIPKRFIKIDNQPEIGGATAIYRDTHTGAVGTRADFGLAS